LGAEAHAGERAIRALERLKAVERLELITYPGEMGAEAARACGFEPTVVGTIEPGATTAEDTVAAARQMRDLGVDLLLFAGGDGTARDIYRAVDMDLTVLGIPAGVKIHSAVYATSPANAGSLAALYLQGRIDSLQEAEVMDIDEEAFRQGSVSATLYGYLKIPFRNSLVQGQKMASFGGSAALEPIAEEIAEQIETDWVYVIGPGTTTRAIGNELGIEKTLLGVDVVQVVRDEEDAEPKVELVATDANEAELLAILQECQRVKIIVTPIGGQGYIFGRGNQQLSPAVIRAVIDADEKADKPSQPWERILVIATREKLNTLGSKPLLVDTGDPGLDERLNGYVQVVTGYRERAVRRVAS
jgi:predicted polyphosphate/ATP-dependent NAD kinase